MPTLNPRASAQIIPFPLRKPEARAARLDAGRPAQSRPPAVCGGSWYHDAAIQEAHQDETRR